MVPRQMKRSPHLSWSRLTAELRRRDVYPFIVAYAVVAWILLQIGEVTFEPLGLPAWAMTALIIIVIAGFPVALLIAWRYDIAPFGIDQQRGPGHEVGQRPGGHRGPHLHAFGGGEAGALRRAVTSRPLPCCPLRI